jgi:hypothetical protein
MRLKLVLPGLYLGWALYVWIDFIRLPPDGLANLGLMLVTLPVTIAGLLLTWLLGATSFVLLPDGLGYYATHAAYYWPSVGLIAAALYWLCAILSRRR